MSSAPMRYREIAPSDRVSGLVASLWEFTANDSLKPGHLHSIPLDGCVSVAYARSSNGGSRVVFVGPRLESLQVAIFPNDIIWGIRFLPGASRPAIGKSGEEWFGKSGLLAYEMPDLVRALGGLHSVASLEEAAPLLEGLVQSNSPCPEVMRGVYAITASQGTVKVSELPDLVGLSERQFQRLFRSEVGLTPKQYSRICRLRGTAIDVARARSINWGEIAAERGFADQSHLIHEFQSLFGISPGEFEGRFLAEIEHGDMRLDL
ncbi:MAG: helix-turn-helix transcriptional regulator [Chlorobia bacterium]|nr:helix-turn-helix transcriptional regulator [Fimbriimonadaceae bacterium]